MRPLKSLTFESIIALLKKAAGEMPDKRDRNRVVWKLTDTVISAFAMFFFQHPSLLKYQRNMKNKHGLSNLQRMFGIADVPSDTQMREILDGVPIEPLRRVLPETFERMRRIGWTERYTTEVNGEKVYTVALDGSEYFHSTKIECPGCLRRKSHDGETQYSHMVVAATAVKAGSHAVLPMDVEQVRNEDGMEKQDCELNAAKRLASRLREEHRQMKICLVGDDLYGHEPFIEQIRESRLGFVFVGKPSSHKEMFQWIEDWDRLGECEKGEWQEGPAAKRRFYQYRIARQVPVNEGGRVTVNYVELWEHNKEGQQIYHNSWITDYEVNGGNVATICAIGRSRWKIENEHFNVHKNHGYELEHNYGHGNQTLSMVFYLLNLLAFLAHQVLDCGDRLYQQCLAGDSRRGLWGDLRTLVCYLEFESWEAMLRYNLSCRSSGP